MGPDKKRIPHDEVNALCTRILHLYRQALPDPDDPSLFNRLMHEARAKGLTWVEGLEYAAGRQRTSFR